MDYILAWITCWHGLHAGMDYMLARITCWHGLHAGMDYMPITYRHGLHAAMDYMLPWIPSKHALHSNIDCEGTWIACLHGLHASWHELHSVPFTDFIMTHSQKVLKFCHQYHINFVILECIMRLQVVVVVRWQHQKGSSSEICNSQTSMVIMSTATNTTEWGLLLLFSVHHLCCMKLWNW